MPVPAHQKTINEFFEAISPLEKAFRHVGFSYLAARFGTRFVLLHGRVFLNTSMPAAGPTHFQSAHVRAGNYQLDELKLDVRGLLEQLLSGTLPTPGGELSFPRGPPATTQHHFCRFIQKASRSNDAFPS
jgi:hypothetical protein